VPVDVSVFVKIEKIEYHGIILAFERQYAYINTELALIWLGKGFDMKCHLHVEAKNFTDNSYILYLHTFDFNDFIIKIYCYYSK